MAAHTAEVEAHVGDLVLAPLSLSLYLLPQPLLEVFETWNLFEGMENCLRCVCVRESMCMCLGGWGGGVMKIIATRKSLAVFSLLEAKFKA